MYRHKIIRFAKEAPTMEPKTFDELPDVLRPEDIQKFLIIGRNAVYEYLKSGKLKSIWIAGKYRVPKPYLKEFIYSEFTTIRESDASETSTEMEAEENGKTQERLKSAPS